MLPLLLLLLLLLLPDQGQSKDPTALFRDPPEVSDPNICRSSLFCDPAGVVDPAWILLLTLGFAGLFACIGNTGTIMMGLHPDMWP